MALYRYQETNETNTKCSCRLFHTLRKVAITNLPEPLFVFRTFLTNQKVIKQEVERNLHRDLVVDRDHLKQCLINWHHRKIGTLYYTGEIIQEITEMSCRKCI